VYYKSNVKKGIKNRTAHYVVSNYQYVAFQDDDILSWQALYGIRGPGDLDRENSRFLR